MTFLTLSFSYMSLSLHIIFSFLSLSPLLGDNAYSYHHSHQYNSCHHYHCNHQHCHHHNCLSSCLPFHLQKLPPQHHFQFYCHHLHNHLQYHYDQWLTWLCGSYFSMSLGVKNILTFGGALAFQMHTRTHIHARTHTHTHTHTYIYIYIYFMCALVSRDI